MCVGQRGEIAQPVFHCCDKISEKINLKEERFTLAQGFGGVSPWSLGSVISGPV
jgi:hypothetical protein